MRETAIFLAPVIEKIVMAKHLEQKLHTTKSYYSEHILPFWLHHAGLVATSAGFLCDGPFNSCGKMSESLGKIYLIFVNLQNDTRNY